MSYPFQRLTLSILAFSLGISAATTTGWAADQWEHVFSHQQGEMYYNHTSLKKEGSIATFWGKRLYKKPMTAPKPMGGFMFQELHVKHKLDCNTRMVTYTHSIFYDPAGKLQGSFEEETHKPQPISKNGFVSKAAERACGKALAGTPAKQPQAGKSPAAKPTSKTTPAPQAKINKSAAQPAETQPQAQLPETLNLVATPDEPPVQAVDARANASTAPEPRATAPSHSRALRTSRLILNAPSPLQPLVIGFD